MRHVLTSEAVTRGHSDKLCDQVADGVLDALLTEDPEARAACEAAVWENHLLLFGEISARQEPDYEAVAREVLRDIGYDRPGLGLEDVYKRQSQNSSTYRTGCVIIRCTSRNISVTFRMDFSTGMPMEILGTNTPSITSTWT